MDISILLLLILVSPYLIGVVVDMVDIKTSGYSVPKEFSSRISIKDYKKHVKYLRERTLFGIIEGAVETSLLLLLIFSGSLNSVDIWARTFNYPTLVTGILFSGVFFLALNLISLPFSWYETFVIEEKYGFNQTKLRTFIEDKLKEATIVGCLSAALYSIVVYVFMAFPHYAWVIGLGVTTLVSIILSFIFPIWIMPLFNKFSPLPKGELREMITKYAKSQKVYISNIFTMDSSRRSTKTNAFFTGFGKFKRIVLFDTVVKEHTPSEIVSILAHEIGHYKKNHIVKLFIISTISNGFMFYVIGKLVANRVVFDFFNIENVSVYAGVFAVIILYSPIQTLLGVVTNYVTRKFEYEADMYSILTYPQRDVFIEALTKLAKSNFANLSPHPLKVWWGYSHPPVLARIEAIKKISYT